MQPHHPTIRSLFTAFERVNAHWRRSLSLSANEFLVLFHLWMSPDGAMSTGQAGELINLTSGGLTSLVNRLEDAGHLRRQSDEVDRRRSILTLTQQGEDARRSFLAMLHELDDYAGNRDGDDAAAIADYLRDATQMLERIVAESSGQA